MIRIEVAKIHQRHADKAVKCGTVKDGFLEVDEKSDCWKSLVTKSAPPAKSSSSSKPAEKKNKQPASLVGWGWAAVKESWGKAVSFSKSAASRGVIATARDQGGERIGADRRALRIMSCHGSADRPPCVARAFATDGQFHFCNDCGCADREVARLDSLGSKPDQPVFAEGDYDKLDYPYLECPRHQPGFSNALEPVDMPCTDCNELRAMLTLSNPDY